MNDAIADDTAVSNINPTKQIITFAEDNRPSSDKDKALYIPPPWKRERGTYKSGSYLPPFLTNTIQVPRFLRLMKGFMMKMMVSPDKVAPKRNSKSIASLTWLIKGRTEKVLSRRPTTRSIQSRTHTLERVVTSMFILGGSPSSDRGMPTTKRRDIKQLDLPNMSSQATIGRNSQFHNLSAKDRETLGGIEYRSLKLLLKIVVGYFFGLHLFGAICLVGWILHADPKYRDYLSECGQGNVWW